MSVPTNYESLQHSQPEYMAAVEQLGRIARQSGPLDAKTVHLIQLAAAAAIRSEGAVHSHVRRALDEGATFDEVQHTLIVLTSTIGFPNVSAAWSWAKDVAQGSR
jgi:4-carboxymuconolactone decarboxylase